MDTFDVLEGVYKADLKVLEKRRELLPLREAQCEEGAGGSEKATARKGPVFPRYESMAAVMNAGAIEAKEATTAAAGTASGEVVGEEEELESDEEEGQRWDEVEKKERRGRERKRRR